MTPDHPLDALEGPEAAVEAATRFSGRNDKGFAQNVDLHRDEARGILEAALPAIHADLRERLLSSEATRAGGVNVRGLVHSHSAQVEARLAILAALKAIGLGEEADRG